MLHALVVAFYTLPYLFGQVLQYKDARIGWLSSAPRSFKSEAATLLEAKASDDSYWQEPSLGDYDDAKQCNAVPVMTDEPAAQAARESSQQGSTEQLFLDLVWRSRERCAHLEGWSMI
eukprot:gnl/MRDRNA2_/MRDRNA2_32645_c0_seq1.p1 gnl/MRDRNA2_/MRDRNA2_32645_c0~~gnl/MRDRNA2_/MRDRNA2_32645_c0_seq1.p1  ORF type:complete len:118 (-),score=18.23 gnl/MRDRNA2_/MRDRNA2_32645_c0_seq1:30-383(-)